MTRTAELLARITEGDRDTDFLVYGLYDPRNGELFYVGKSHRGFEKAMRHANQWSNIVKDKNHPKLRRIASILAAGEEPQVWPLAYPKTAKETAEVETQLIRQWSKHLPLTNVVNHRRASLK